MSKRRTGKCSVCGMIKDLSFEHVPPKSAYNKDRTFEAIDFIKWIQDDGNYKIRKKIRGGIGSQTLCKKCNNLGGKYAREYKEWTEIGVEILKQYHSNAWSGILKGVYPLRFLKEVVIMFCSLNGPQFAEKYTDVREFILSEDSKKLPPEITIFMYLNSSKMITRTGIMSLIEFSNPSNFYIVSEINFPPFGFAMYIGNAKNNGLTDITWFDDYEYAEMVDIPFELPVIERNVPFPADYRTELEIEYDKIINMVEEANLKKR